MATATRIDPHPRILPRHLIAGLWAGLAASIVEMIPVLFIQNLLGTSPLRVFQSIASGLLGANAYAGGSATALLGGGLHLFISVVAGLSYAFASAFVPMLIKRPIVGGILAGIVAYVVMTFLVVPLSAAPFPANRDPALMAASLTVHIVAFGLPIAWTCRRLLGRAR